MCSSSVDLIVKNTMVQLDLDLGIRIGKYDFLLWFLLGPRALPILFFCDKLSAGKCNVAGRTKQGHRFLSV